MNINLPWLAIYLAHPFDIANTSQRARRLIHTFAATRLGVTESRLSLSCQAADHQGKRFKEETLETFGGSFNFH